MKKKAYVATALSGITALSAAVLLAPNLVNAAVPAAQFPATTVTIDETNFPDENFREYVKLFDNGDNKLTPAELSLVTKINVRSKQIADLTGIEHFENLTSLIAYDNQLTALDVSKNLNLTELNCSANQITKLDVTLNTELTKLVCSENQLKKLNVTKNTALQMLYCEKNQIETLTLTKNKELTELDCSENPITSLDLHVNKKLQKLDCAGLELTELDLSNNKSLKAFVCKNIQVKSLDFSAMNLLQEIVVYSGPNLESIVLPNDKNEFRVFYAENTKMTTMDLSGAAFMHYVRADDNPLLSKVILEGCNGLEELYVNNDPKLTTIQASSLPSLTTLYCRYSGFTKLDLSAYTKLSFLSCAGCKFSTLDLRKNTKLGTVLCSQETNDTECTKIKVLNVTGLDNLSTIECEYNEISVLDTSNKNMYRLKCTDNKISKLDLSSSVQLSDLYCSDNQLTSLDLSASTELRYVKCYNNKITKLTLPETSRMTGLECFNNQLKALDVSKQSSLYYLTCNDNALTSLKVSGLKSLDTCYCQNNELTSLDVTGCSKLKDLNCQDNKLSSLVLTDAVMLRTVQCCGNCLKKLDLSGLTALQWLDCRVNLLDSLNLSENPNMKDLVCYGNRIPSVNIDPCPILVEAAMSQVMLIPDSYNDETYDTIIYMSDSGMIRSDLTTGFISVSLTPTPTPLPKPSNLKAEVKSATTILVTWDPIPGADTYKITYYGEKDGAYVDGIKYDYVDKPEFLRTDLKPGTTYNFYVGADYSDRRFPNPYDSVSATTFELTSVPKPTGATPKPTGATPKPTGATPKPTGATPKPTGATPKPTGATPKPTGATPKPTGAKPKPTGATPKPTGATPKPTGATPKPTGATPKPTGATPKPTGATPKPTGATPKPTGATPKPTGATPKPTGATPKPGQPTPTPKPKKEPTIADFVERLYTIALDRPSEPAGKAFWVNEIESGNRTGGNCAHFFLIEAPEFLNRGLSNDDFVETLYLTFFGRASEPAGKKFWVDGLKSGKMTKEYVINGFIDSTEWCNICATYGVKSGAPNAKAEFASKNAIKFATRLYTECLGREPEEGGLKYWSLALTNLEQTGCSAAKNFFTSAEFVGFKLKDEEYVRRLYTTFMGRNPEASEVAYWAGEIKAGRQTKESVMAFFGQSEEFTKICKLYGIDRGTI